MYIEDIISKLNKKVVRFHNVDYYPAITVQDILRDKASESISWSVDDFQAMAIDNSDPDVWEQYYNKDMFESALRTMVSKHDASIGITWDTIDYYLEIYCKIKEYNPPLQMKYKNKKSVLTTTDLNEIDESKAQRK